MEIVESRPGTTLSGVTGRGFKPGQSGNPGGRPKGLTRRVRELVGDNGEAIAAFMYEVMTDDAARTADRMEAAKWLADRGFGKAIQALEVDVNQYPALDITEFSLADKKALLAILDTYEPDAAQLAESGELRFDVGPAEPVRAAGYRQR